MNELKAYLKEHFLSQYSESGSLVKMCFSPSKTLKSRILVIGSEHGDKPFGTKAMIKLMHELVASPLAKTGIDFVPVLDTDGYPNKRTIIGDEGFGKPMYLDHGYSTSIMPVQIKDLLSMLGDKYSLAVQLNALFVEEAPVVNGYFAVPQVHSVQVDKKKRLVLNPKVKDLVGSVLNAVKEKGYPLLSRSQEGYVGDGYVLASDGIVLPGVKDGEEIEFRTSNAFAMACERNNLSAVVFYAMASKFGAHSASLSHKAALDAIVKMCEL